MYFAVLFVSLQNCLQETDELGLNLTLIELESRSPRHSERLSSIYKELSELKALAEMVLKLGTALTDGQVTYFLWML